MKCDFNYKTAFGMDIRDYYMMFGPVTYSWTDYELRDKFERMYPTDKERKKMDANQLLILMQQEHCKCKQPIESGNAPMVCACCGRFSKELYARTFTHSKIIPVKQCTNCGQYDSYPNDLKEKKMTTENTTSDPEAYNKTAFFGQHSIAGQPTPIDWYGETLKPMNTLQNKYSVAIALIDSLDKQTERGEVCSDDYILVLREIIKLVGADNDSK